MTNAQIIFNASVALMKGGTIKGTGQFISVEMEDGSTEELEIPEAIHTYSTWAELGRQVKKGEKCRARIDIWKYSKGKKIADAETGEETEAEPHMFKKTAFFFTYDQTEPAKGNRKR